MLVALGRKLVGARELQTVSAIVLTRSPAATDGGDSTVTITMDADDQGRTIAATAVEQTTRAVSMARWWNVARRPVGG